MLPTIAIGTYTYHASLNAQPSGTSSIVVKRSGTTTEIDEQTAGTIAGINATASATLILGNNLVPTAYNGKYQGDGQAATSSVTFSANAAQVIGPSGTLTFGLTAPATHFAILDGALLAGFVALPAEMQAWNGAPAQAIAPVYGQSVALALAPSTVSTRPTDLPKADVAISVGGPYPFTLWYDPTTFITDELQVPSQGIIVTRAR